jgi:signal transduction histidine kinase
MNRNRTAPFSPQALPRLSHDVSAAATFLNVTTDRRAYLGLLYSMLRLPIAFFYFLLLATTLPTALGLLPVGVGFLVFMLVLVCTWGCAIFEREVGRWWFGFDLRPMSAPAPRPRPGGWLRLAIVLRDFLLNAVTWKALAYVLLQIPLGIVAFMVVVAMASGTLALVSAPFLYLLDAATTQPGDPRYSAFFISGPMAGPGLEPVTLVYTAVLAFLGVALGIVTLHVGRAIVLGYQPLMQALLGMSRSQLELAAARNEAAMEHARAERSEQARKELIVNVSHELRTPIASIRGHVDALLDPGGGRPSREETRRYLAIVQKETERLSSLVDDLLAVTRADAGELTLDIRAVDVAPIAEHAAEALGPIARRDRKVTLTTAIATGLPPVFADPDRLSQVLVNLVRNAITYTPEGGIVSIELADDGAQHLQLSVADTGVGIPADELDRIFERLYRVDSSRSRSTGGFGLGLAIARDLVQAMGGTIEVESEVGGGSRFTVRLRKA